MYQDDFQLLEQKGWLVTCESPFEIADPETGDIATGSAAYFILSTYRDKWIVGDKPEESGDYLVTREDGSVLVGYYDAELQRWSKNLLYGKVIAYTDVPAGYNKK